MTDVIEKLVLRARERDPDAFAALIAHFERPALAVAYGVLHDGHRAGDAVQEAFLRAWQELPGLHELSRFGAWLMQIVRNASIDARRRIIRRGPTTPEFPDLAAAGPSPEEDLAQRERATKIQEALAELDETTRMAVTLRYYEGLSAREIGQMLDLSPAAVDMRLSRARGVLKTRLGDLADSPVVKPVPRVIGDHP